MVAAPSPPYVGPAKFHGTRSNKPLRRVVIHGTVSPCAPGGARSIAAYFRKTVTRPSSAHYVVDPGEVVQVVFDSWVAYHAPPNSGSIGVELCDPVAGSPARWKDANHVAMLARAAHLVAGLCLAYGIPLRKVGPAGLRIGRRGICGHVDVSNAWHQTTHTDPGAGFPWDQFMALVKEEAKKIRDAQSPSGPVSPPPPPVDPGKPEPPTDVARFHDECRRLIIKYLDPAIADGRDDVRAVRKAIADQLHKMPAR